MNTLIKRLENGTDFDVCVFQSPKGCFYVTSYDTISRKHVKEGTFPDKTAALRAASKLNREYMI